MLTNIHIYNIIKIPSNDLWGYHVVYFYDWLNVLYPTKRLPTLFTACRLSMPLIVRKNVSIEQRFPFSFVSLILLSFIYSFTSVLIKKHYPSFVFCHNRVKSQIVTAETFYVWGFYLLGIIVKTVKRCKTIIVFCQAFTVLLLDIDLPQFHPMVTIVSYFFPILEDDERTGSFHDKLHNYKL